MSIYGKEKEKNDKINPWDYFDDGDYPGINLEVFYQLISEVIIRDKGELLKNGIGLLNVMVRMR